MVIKYLILFFAVFFVSCQKEAVKDESPVIMRVGTALLTKNDVSAAIGAHASPEQKLNYIQNWSDKELAYQAAVETGLDKDETTKRIIENMKKGFLSVQFIQQKVGNAEAVEVLPDEIQKEFRENSQKYTRKEPVVRVARIVTATRMDAWKIREGLTAENFRSRGAPASLEKMPPFEDIKFAPRSDFNPEVFSTIFSTRVTGVTSPLQEDDKYSIYLILAKEDVGSQSLLDEVIDDVKRNILTKKQNKVVRDIYENLRNRYDYSYDQEYIANLENQQKRAANQEQKE